jgi:hypothetical protein
MHANIEIYSPSAGVLTLSTDDCTSRGDAISAAAYLVEMHTPAVLMRVSLIAPHATGYDVLGTLTDDVRALLAWRSDVRWRQSRAPHAPAWKTVGA